MTLWTTAAASDLSLMRWTLISEATETARAALEAAGLPSDLRVVSRPSHVAAGPLRGAIRTDVWLYPGVNSALVRKTLAKLPGVVDVDAGYYGAHVYRNLQFFAGWD